MANSKEILAFKKHFQENTGIKIFEVIEERTFFHWKRLKLPPKIDSEQMELISKYIKNTFSTKGKYTHLCVCVGVYDNCLYITCDVEDINKFILKQKS